jgi:hypothetical protein
MIVDFTWRGWWTSAHGVVLAAGFLLLMVLTVGSLLQLRAATLTSEGIDVRVRWVRRGMLVMMLTGWAAVLLGAFVIDGWFSKHTAASPFTVLDSSGWWAWQERVMEWKERIAFASAALATAGTYVAFYYGRQLAFDARARATALILFVLALSAGSVAGVLGMLLAKVSPLR